MKKSAQQKQEVVETKVVEETALQPATEQSVDLASNLGGGMVKGLSDIDSEDRITVPAIRICQPTTKDRPEGVNEGDFFIRSTGETFGSSCVIIPISEFKTRTLWKEDENGKAVLDEPPLCSSQNAKFPTDLDGKHTQSPADPQGQVHHDCRTCFFSQRMPDPDKPSNFLPSKCKRSINFFAYALHVGEAVENDDPDRRICRFQFVSTSYSAGKQIIEAAMFGGQEWLHDKCYQLTTHVKEDARGRWFEPRIRVLKLTKDRSPIAHASCASVYRVWEEIQKMVLRESVAPEDAKEVNTTEAATRPAGDTVEPVDDIPF